jgi:hypothetical protein
VPAAAVIPAPKGYINVVAVKKLVVEFRMGMMFWFERSNLFLSEPPVLLWVQILFRSLLCGMRFHSVTESKLECSKQAL